MSAKKHALKRSAQNINNSISNTPSKPVQSKLPKPNECNDMMKSKENEKDAEIRSMFEVIVGKLSKLDGIDSRIKSVEQELKTMKASVEFVHEEVQDLKNENGKLKEMDIETTQRNFLIKLFILKLSISHVHNFFKHINIK